VALRRQEQNLPPTCAAAAAAIPYGKPTGVALSCLDANGDPLALSIVTGPGRGTLGPVDGARATVVYTPAKGFSGTDAFSFQASDGVLASAAATITLTVAADAVPPVVRILSTRATLHARLVRFRIVCSLDEVSCRGALALTLGRRVATRGASGERGDLLGRRRFLLAGGASTTLGVTLSRKAARLVRRANGLAAVATVRASDAAGNRSTISRAVRLRPGARSRGPA
jgi:hypothetical protein